MKNFAKLLIMTHLLCAGPPALALGIEAKMSSFKMSTCAPSKECLSVEASSSEGSQLRPLHRLTKPVTTFKTAKGKTQTIQADSGYIDLSENQLVLYKRQAGKLKETSFNLTTLERQDMLHGDL